MKAVNLIPAESRRAGGGSSELRVPIYVFVGFLAGVLALVTVWVLASNTIATRQAQLADLQSQVTAEQTLASQLGNYAQFASVAKSRVQTVRAIAATRFHWHEVLSELAQVVPANTSLLSLQGTVAPGASAAGSSGGSGGAGALRSQIASPALEMTGCTAAQDDVARLMSRLRLITGVTRVTLGASVKAASGSSGSGSSGSSGCPANQPAFDVLVFFQPLPGAGPTGATSVSAPTTGSATPGATAGTAPQVATHGITG